MQSSQSANLQELLSGLGSILRPRLGPEPSTMEKTVTEGLILPDVATMTQNAVDPQSVPRPMQDAIEWIKTVLRPEYLRGGWERQLVGLQRAVNGQDVIAGAWTAGERAVQVMVTMRRVHVIGKLPSPAGDDQQEMARAALENAVELLRIEELPALEEWELRTVAGLLMGQREVSFARNWFEALIFVTDGKGAKYSVMKYKNRSSPPQRQGPERIGPSWFEASRAADLPRQAGSVSPPRKNEIEPE